MNRSLRRLMAAALCAGAALLTGCATAPPPISSAQTLSGQEGAVVVRLITNGRSANDPSETLSSLTMVRELPPGVKASSEDTAILTRTREMTHSTAIFSGMVAPGRYRITQANGFFAGVSYTFPLTGKLGHFQVKPKEVTLLGTLLVQPLEGQRFAVGYLPPEKELTQTFQTLFPALAEQTRDQTPNQFEPGPAMNLATALTPAFRMMAATHNGLQSLADGTLVAGNKMGRIAWRKAGDERLRSLQVDSWLEVLSVRPYRDGLLIAGEEGLLRFTADEGKTWQALPAPAPGLIAAAEPLSNGKVLALVRRGTLWSAHVSDNPLAGGWRKLASFEQERSLNVPWQNAIVLAGGNRAGVMMPNGEFLVVDGATETLARRPTGVSSFDAQILADGTLLASGGTMTRTTFVSTDGGQRWTDLATSRFVAAITAADAKTYYAVGPIAPGVFAGDYALMVSRDGAKTWSKSGEVPGGVPHLVRSLLVDRRDGALLAVMANGRLMRSADEGKTWSNGL